MGYVWYKAEGMTKKAWELRHAFLEFLKAQDGKVKSPVIAKHFGIGDESVRALTNFWRANVEGVCADNEGYWYSRDLAEIAAQRSSLQGRMSAMGEADRGLEIYESHLRMGIDSRQERLL